MATTVRAFLTGAAVQSVTWAIVETGGGTVSTTGLYTAPSTSNTYHVTATSSADPTKSATATVTVTAAPPPPPPPPPPPSGSPVLLATDIVSGSLTGGENGLGAYMSLFGHKFGDQPALGTAAGARVFFRRTGDSAWYEVANYRAKISSRTYAKNGVEQLIVQLGTLGSPAAGSTMDVKVTVNGQDSNILASYFTVQPGRFWFVSNGKGTAAVGDDSTCKPDDITKPCRYVQNNTTSSQDAFTGIWAAKTAQGDAGLRAGDTIVIRGGTWQDYTGWTDNGNTHWVRFRYPRHNGSAPNGQVGHGYITFVRYPGPILGNAPENVNWVDQATGGGGIHGPNSAYVGTTGQYVVISGLRGQMGASASSDGAFINLQNGGDYWRVVDVESGPWPTTAWEKAAGICGEGDHVLVAFNYIHDIGGSTANPENHGIYTGSGGPSNKCSTYWDVSYNWISNVTAGSCYQWNDNYYQDTVGFAYNRIHHNWLEHCARAGLNAASNTGAGNEWSDNVILDASAAPVSGLASLSVNQTYNSATHVDILHNTIVQYNSGAASAMVYVGSAFTSGAVNVVHNIFALGPGHTNTFGDWVGSLNGSSIFTFSQNLYYNFTAANGGPTAKYGSDALGIYGNPLFTSAPTSLSSAGDYSLQATSPAVGAATSANPVPVATDFLGNARPVPGTGTPGATRNDLGAFQSK